MSHLRGMIWIATFSFLLLLFPLSYYITKGYVDNINYGQRNAAYTYFDHGTYVNTAKSQIEETPEKPKLSIGNYEEFPAQYEAYYNDSLPYKKLLIRINSMSQYYLFRQSSHSDVVVGSKGWLFYKPAIHSTIDTGDFSQEELAEIATNLTEIEQSLHEEGKDFVLFIPPNKSTVYGEYLPNCYQRNKQTYSKVEQLILYLRQNTDIKVVYPLEELMEAKQSMPDIELYHRLDTHWNSAGAYIGAQCLAAALGKELPPLSSVTRKEFVFEESDLTNMLGMPVGSGTVDYALTNYGDADTYIINWDYNSAIQYQTKGKENNLVILGDSFRTALGAPIATLFNNSYSYQLSTDAENVQHIEEANVVVVEYVERNIDSIQTLCLS